MGSGENLGQELRVNNEKIVECILLLREQRAELIYIIEKQYEERKRLETEMERITYKLCLLNKSLAQRINAKTCYDKTLQEMEEKYANLVKNSADLLMYIKEEFSDLESMINKKTSTDDGPAGGYAIDTQASGERGQLGSITCKCKPLREKLIPEKHVGIDKEELKVQEQEKEVARFELDSTPEQPIEAEKLVETFNVYGTDVISDGSVKEGGDFPKTISPPGSRLSNLSSASPTGKVSEDNQVTHMTSSSYRQDRQNSGIIGMQLNPSYEASLENVDDLDLNVEDKE